MKTRNYNEHEVVNQLKEKADLVINSTLKIVYEIVPPHAKGDVGIKSRGKISFLRKYCGYRHLQVTEEFVSKMRNKKH